MKSKIRSIKGLNEKGSALVLSVIVLVNALLIVTTIASMSAVSQKMSGKTKNSSVAFQAADSGAEFALKEIYDNDGSLSVRDFCKNGILNNTTGKCETTLFSAVPSTQVELYFMDESEGLITDGNISADEIKYIRSVGKVSDGSGEMVSRAVEVNVSARDVFVCGTSTIADGEGNFYDTVEIGDQCWMAKNLNVGVRIDSTNTGSVHSDVSDNGIIEKYCYDNNTSNCNVYGGLYDWNEAMGYITTAGAQGICPNDWHIPTDGELYSLENYLATGVCDPNRIGWSCEPAGDKLKIGGSSGFNALLSGIRDPEGSFIDLSVVTFFMSSTQYNEDQIFRRRLTNEDEESGTYRSRPNKKTGFSVRCVMD